MTVYKIIFLNPNFYESLLISLFELGLFIAMFPLFQYTS